MSMNDPLLGTAWYIHNTGQTGAGIGFDLNLLPVWANYTGRGIRVAVTDEGVELAHPDLIANIDVAASFDAVQDTKGNGSGGAYWDDENHGTAVAGIIGASGNNGIGSAGVAYGATLVSYRIDLGGAEDPVKPVPSNMQAALSFQNQLADGIDVSNNSWGSDRAFSHAWSAPDSQPLKEALENLGTLGRGGLGTNIVFAAGNDRATAPDAQLDNLLNNHFVITVAALNENGTASIYSSPGSSLFISAFGGGDPAQRPDIPGNAITTTDRLGMIGYHKAASPTGDYTYNMNGTSAATPMVSGVIALMLEANAELGYRDVKNILAYSARLNDPAAESWTFTHAVGANGGGLHYSRDYGFGLIDAHAAVRLSEVWSEASGAPRTEANLESTTAVFDSGNPPAGTVIAGQGQKVSFVFNQIDDLVANHVELDLNLTSLNPKNLIIELISPDGTTIELVKTPGNAVVQGTAADGTPLIRAIEWDEPFTLGTPAFLGEHVQGSWTLTIRDVGPATASTIFQGATLRFLGDDAEQPVHHIFTDDFAALAARDATRLEGFGSLDVVSRLNAAAVTGDVVFDLTGATPSSVNGQVITLTQGARFDRVFGGDGNDRLIGDGQVELFYGGRGADFIDAGASAGRAATALYDARMNYSVNMAADGSLVVQSKVTATDTDQLLHIARLQFDEGILYAPAATDFGVAAAALYVGLLGRDAEAGGYRFWTSSGADVNSLAQGFLSSQEYQQGAGQQDNTTFVSHLYINLLGRAAEDDGLAFWANALAGNLGREDLVLDFVNSAEFAHGASQQLLASVASLGDLWAA